MFLQIDNKCCIYFTAAAGFNGTETCQAHDDGNETALP